MAGYLYRGCKLSKESSNAGAVGPVASISDATLRFRTEMAKGAINLFVLGIKPLDETLLQCKAVLAAGSQDEDIQKFVLENDK